ncbi:MAG TPA: cation:proton antiporter [Gemmatimonadaceae bacterium]|jgi:Kef-type K+ transport system membrane component KefB
MNLWAAMAAPASGGPDVPALLLTLAAVLVATKVIGALARRINQPAVLGELVAGILLGGSVLGVLDSNEPVLHVLSEIGVLILLFEVGLETDLQSLRRVGGAALTVGGVGIVVPFAGGFAVASAFGASTFSSLVIAAALTATSIGITARVLGDLGRLKSDEGQIVLGAAVIDDVLGLVILAVVSGLVAGESLTTLGVASKALVAIGFVVAAVVLGAYVARPLMDAVSRVRVAGTVGVTALVLVFVTAAIAARVGSAMIIGAFAAGLVLHRTPQRHEIEKWVTSLGHALVPVFFASVGAAVDLRAMFSPAALGLGAALIVVAVVGKVVAGYAPWWFRGRKLLVGVAMVPRGEVGLIFAQMGVGAGVLAGGEFGAVIAMIVVTTFLTPPLLALVAGPSPTGRGDGDGESGLNELVAEGAPPAPPRRATQARPRLN